VARLEQLAAQQQAQSHGYPRDAGL
jgi:hypothetical protein